MKSLALIFCCLFVSMQAYSQFGIRAGYNGANFSISENNNSPEQTGGVWGLNFGVFYELAQNEKWAYRASLMLMTKGGKINEIKESLGYLEIPLDIIYRIRTSSVNFPIYLGPSIAYAVSGDINQEGIKDWENYNRFEFGFNFGFGVEFKHFTIGLNYNNGITKLRETGDFKTRNRVGSLNLLYRF